MNNIPAFPRAQSNPMADGRQDGMTLRDYFAGQALAGIAMLVRQNGTTDGAKERVDWCYEIADMMLQATQRTLKRLIGKAKEANNA